MEFGASVFFTDYSIFAAGVAVALEERGFARSGSRAFAHPDLAAHPGAGWRCGGDQRNATPDGEARHVDRPGPR
jgi:hypothetical protein